MGDKRWVTDSRFAVHIRDNVVVLVWKEPPVIEGVRACAQAMDTIATERPETKIGFMTHVEPKAQEGAPSAPVRHGLTQLLNEHKDRIRASVIVYEGNGFKATIVRSVVTAIQTASSLRFPARVVSDRGTGARWLLEHLRGETTATPAELVALTNPGHWEQSRL
jgi:hypothetical protein